MHKIQFSSRWVDEPEKYKLKAILVVHFCPRGFLEFRLKTFQLAWRNAYFLQLGRVKIVCEGHLTKS